MSERPFGFASYEYLEGFRESLLDLKVKAGNLLQIVNNASVGNYLLDFKNKCNSILRLTIKFVDRNLTTIEKIKCLGKKELEDTYLSYIAFDRHCAALRSVEKAINQRFGSFHYDDGFFPEIPVDRSEAKISNAVDKLVEHLTMVFFGTSSNPLVSDEYTPDQTRDPFEYRIITMTIFGDIPTQETMIHLLEEGEDKVMLVMVNMPNPDIHRFRYWTSLAHELAHVKLTRTIQTSEQEETESFGYLGDGDEIYSQLTDRLYHKLGELYKASPQFSEYYQQNTARCYFFLMRQIDEIIADIASLLIFGLPSMLTLICCSGTPKQGLGLICDHPPLSVRVIYMLKILRDSPNQPSLFKETLDDLEREWQSMVQACDLKEQDQLFISAYSAIVEEAIGGLYEFTRDYFILNYKPIRPQTWDEFVSMFENEKSELSSSPKSPILSLVRAWAKRWVTYKKLVSSGKGNFCDFSKWHSTETKIYGQLVNELNRMS